MKPDPESIRKYAAIAQVFAEAMGQGYDVQITQVSGPVITGRAARRVKGPVVSEAGLTLYVELSGGGETAIHLADVQTIKAVSACA